MRKKEPALYATLQDDTHWLLQHIESLHTEQTERETRFFVQESEYHGVAPSISSGTGRILAMLTAFYALDMRSAEMPGLVVIEEPDTALNPAVLRNFVEQLRYFTTGENPRQVIMTTHNPRFLDYFEPEEVRVVERDEKGYTTVRRVPDHIRETWLDEYGLGEVWMTNSLGGLPE
jgi:predicted ATPase